MSNPEGSIRAVDLRVLVSNEATDEEAGAYSLSVAYYWLEGVVHDPNAFLFREGTVVELFISATVERDLVPKEKLDADERRLREEMENARLDLSFNEG